eukprot:4583122-Pyramimonas_sp.AAC.1
MLCRARKAIAPSKDCANSRAPASAGHGRDLRPSPVARGAWPPASRNLRSALASSRDVATGARTNARA